MRTSIAYTANATIPPSSDRVRPNVVGIADSDVYPCGPAEKAAPTDPPRNAPKEAANMAVGPWSAHGPRNTYGAANPAAMAMKIQVNPISSIDRLRTSERVALPESSPRVNASGPV